MKRLLFVALSASCPIITSTFKVSPALNIFNSIPRGGDETSYSNLCEEVKSRIVENASKDIEDMRRIITEEGTTIEEFGSKADKICNSALEEFAQNAPKVDDAESVIIFDKKTDELEAVLDAPLQVLYLRQLALLREKALQSFRATSRVSESSDYEAMLKSDSSFTADATHATREGSDWDFSSERAHLQSVMNEIVSTKKKLVDVKLKGTERQNTAMAFLQQQQQMIQQLQGQLYGSSSPWNVGLAYRFPDSNFNLQTNYQQGRATFQLSCVPDEYAPMLGPNGFTNGVGPGNLGVSLNLVL